MASVLVVDDEQLVRATLRQFLEQAGHEVVEAANGRQALNAVKARAYDLIITDILMPEKEGIETIMELRQKLPDLTIIAISGGDRSGAIDVLGVAKKLGANEVLAKPFRREQVLDAVKAALRSAN